MQGFSPAAQSPPAWIARSNANAQVLLNVDSKYQPEAAQRRGMPGFDETVTQLTSDRRARLKADREGAIRELQRRLYDGGFAGIVFSFVSMVRSPPRVQPEIQAVRATDECVPSDQPPPRLEAPADREASLR